MQTENQIDIIYDIETYPNVCTIFAKRANTHKEWLFEISQRKNDIPKFIEFIQVLRNVEARMIGFNNIGFDYPVIHDIILNHQTITVDQIYQKAQSIIIGDKFEHMVWESDWCVNQLDLYKIHHFDNKARRTGLKVLEFNMRSNNIEDLPFPLGTILSDDEIETLIKYNKHDVYQTEQFYNHTKGQIKFREELSEKYGKNFLNFSDAKIGKEYFIMRLEDTQPGSCYERVDGQRQPRQTPRPIIDFSTIIFPWIKFERNEFNAIKDWLTKQKIKETKGIFTDIPESQLGEVAQYTDLSIKKKKIPEPTQSEIIKYQADNPFCWIQEPKTKTAKTWHKCHHIAKKLSVNVDGFSFDFGVGGIHGSVDSQIVKSDDDYVIIDLDVTSYYPSIGIANRLHPEHLGELFCDIYTDVKQQRLKYKKGTPENAMLKLSLNAVYGDSNSQFSPFYDPAYTMGITMNGQLMLCMLSEQLMKIDSLEMIQVNTDGVTIRLKRSDVDKLHEIQTAWEIQTGLELEEAVYSRMFIRDVNNYIAEYENGKVKRKGAYEYELEWHKNQSALVVQKAAEAFLLYGIPVDEFIHNHTDMMDFMLRTKVPRTSRLVLEYDDGEVQVQNITRYIISKQGGKLVKIMPPLFGKTENRRIGINTGYNAMELNDITNIELEEVRKNINYQFYIDEAMKLIKPLIGGER